MVQGTNQTGHNAQASSPAKDEGAHSPEKSSWGRTFVVRKPDPGQTGAFLKQLGRIDINKPAELAQEQMRFRRDIPAADIPDAVLRQAPTEQNLVSAALSVLNAVTIWFAQTSPEAGVGIEIHQQPSHALPADAAVGPLPQRPENCQILKEKVLGNAEMAHQDRLSERARKLAAQTKPTTATIEALFEHVINQAINKTSDNPAAQKILHQIKNGTCSHLGFLCLERENVCANDRSDSYRDPSFIPQPDIDQWRAGRDAMKAIERETRHIIDHHQDDIVCVSLELTKNCEHEDGTIHRTMDFRTRFVSLQSMQPRLGEHLDLVSDTLQSCQDGLNKALDSNIVFHLFRLQNPSSYHHPDPQGFCLDDDSGEAAEVYMFTTPGEDGRWVEHAEAEPTLPPSSTRILLDQTNRTLQSFERFTSNEETRAFLLLENELTLRHSLQRTADWLRNIARSEEEFSYEDRMRAAEVHGYLFRITRAIGLSTVRRAPQAAAVGA